MFYGRGAAKGFFRETFPSRFYEPPENVFRHNNYYLHLYQFCSCYGAAEANFKEATLVPCYGRAAAEEVF